jgi:hypothetical protein
MRLLKAAIATGLAGGALDFAAASIIYPLAYPTATFSRIWQSVAAGLIGRDAARAGGTETALLGIGLHFFIALCAGMVLAITMSRAEIFRRLWPVSGAIYGLAMYYFMQKVVLPLSATGAQHPDAKSLLIGLGIHIFIFGIGSAFVARQFLKRKG